MSPNPTKFSARSSLRYFAGAPNHPTKFSARSSLRYFAGAPNHPTKFPPHFSTLGIATRRVSAVSRRVGMPRVDFCAGMAGAGV